MFEKRKENLLKNKKEDTLIKPLSPFYGDLDINNDINNLKEVNKVNKNEDEKSIFLQPAIKIKESKEKEIKKIDVLNVEEQYKQLTIFDFQTEKDKFVDNLSNYLLSNDDNEYVENFLIENNNNLNSSDELIFKQAGKYINDKNTNQNNINQNNTDELSNKNNLLDKIEYISLTFSKMDLPSRKTKKNTKLIAKLTESVVKYIDYENNRQIKAENKNKEYKRNNKKFNKINKNIDNAKEIILENKKKNKKKNIFILLLILLLILVASGIGYFCLYLPSKNEIIPKQSSLNIELGEKLYPSVNHFFSKYPKDLKIDANSIDTTKEGKYNLLTTDKYNGEKKFVVNVKDTQGPNVVLKYKKYQVRRTLKINSQDLILNVDDNSGIDNLKYTIDKDNFDKEGSYTINITIEDSHGNKTVKEQNIEVVNRWAEELKHELNEENDIIF